MSTTRELPRRWRRLLVLVHVVVSVGWLGAGAANLALAAAAPARVLDAYQAYLAIQLIDTWVVIPAAFATLASGVVLGAFTSWGLVWHRWVLIKLVLTVVVILSSTFGVGVLVELAVERRGLPPGPPHLVTALAAANLVAFVLMTWLSTSKPRGLTRWGRRAIHPSRVTGRRFTGRRFTSRQVTGRRAPNGRGPGVVAQGVSSRPPA